MSYFTLIYSAYDLYYNNPYTLAYEEALLTGKYLAWLLAEKKIFGDSIINLIGFSLGTVVI